MTQLFIDGEEVMLPQNLSVAIKRENSFFTKNGEFTYDITVNLDNDTNRRIYGFLQRLNRKAELPKKRKAVLIADGHEYLNGTESIQSWTQNDVKIQVLSGNSELNYFIGSSLKVEYLTKMGEITGDMTAPFIGANPKYPDVDYCLPLIYNETKAVMYNKWTSNKDTPTTYPTLQNTTQVRAQPYVCAILRRMITALGYTITENELESTNYKYVFFCNFINTTKYYEMFPGWTVKELLEEIENLFNLVITVDNTTRSCSIYSAATYYINAKQRKINYVTDEYEAQIDEDNKLDYSTSNIKYSAPDKAYYKKQILNKAVLGAVQQQGAPTLDGVRLLLMAQKDTDKMFATYNSRKFMKAAAVNKSSTGDGTWDIGANKFEDKFVTSTLEDTNYQNLDEVDEVDMLADLTRDTTEDATEIELKIVPAPMAWHTYRILPITTSPFGQLFGRNSYLCASGLVETISIADDTDDTDEDKDVNIADDTGEVVEDEKLDDYITTTEETSDTSQCQLYVAIYNGMHKNLYSELPTAYTDAYHAQNIGGFWHTPKATYTQLTESFDGSLRLQNINDVLYDGVYKINSEQGITIETFDPNSYDVHELFIINNKRYVCNYIEETLTANGRKAKWKGEFYPIELSDTAARSGWVLDTGTWEDGGVWLDSGKWND